MISLIEFKEMCMKGKCLRKTFISKQCVKEQKQETCYKKYIDKLNNIQMKSLEKDFEWEMLKEEIKIRDNNNCRFYQIATPQEKEILDEELLSSKYNRFLDGAHIIARSKSPELIYYTPNVILLSRYVHRCIDNCVDIITGKNITWEESQNYWIRIVGEKYYNDLYSKYYDIQNNIRMGK